MASGCPVITSNVSSLPEVAGNAARLVDPLNTEEIAQAMSGIASSARMSSRLSFMGRARADQFRWSSCAAAVAGIYREAHAAHGGGAPPRRSFAPASFPARPHMNTRPDKIALYQPYPHTMGGLQAVVLQLGRGLRAKGWNPLIICPEEGAFAGVARKADLPVLVSDPGGGLARLRPGRPGQRATFSPRAARGSSCATGSSLAANCAGTGSPCCIATIIAP